MTIVPARTRIVSIRTMEVRKKEKVSHARIFTASLLMALAFWLAIVQNRPELKAKMSAKQKVALNSVVAE